MKALLLALTALLVCSVCSASEVVLQTIALEGAGEPLDGQVAIASVILTRSAERHKTAEAVCLEKWQFSAWNDRKTAKRWLDKHYTPKVRQNAQKALEMARLGGLRANHYHTKAVRPYWAKGNKPVAVIGNHVFYQL